MVLVIKDVRRSGERTFEVSFTVDEEPYVMIFKESADRLSFSIPEGFEEALGPTMLVREFARVLGLVSRGQRPGFPLVFRE